ncbi:transglycosylase [Fodinibius sediminis]|uniref:Uncharacterized protein n=1 Tax=Fodinibius sediminis TaxID=1214077 RepID=A0A521DXB6_9BACT|nr:transglycosylase [Fodinibius sediminis]SMO76347.1 hypothetical protein SAMN06265218_11236 [Fodinibius sediminis]
MKKLGYIIAIGGLIGLIYTGINYANSTEHVSALGVDVTVSQGDPTAMIISGIVLVAGILIAFAAKNK